MTSIFTRGILGPRSERASASKKVEKSADPNASESTAGSTSAGEKPSSEEKSKIQSVGAPWPWRRKRGWQGKG